jgi:hypothetical protein
MVAVAVAAPVPVIVTEGADNVSVAGETALRGADVGAAVRFT